ncbi:MAG: hypothetical protein ABIM99_02220 [Candidatus Dojkabacteria bacterium]
MEKQETTTTVTSPPIENAVQQTTITTKKSNKKFLIIGLIITLVLCLCVLAGVLYSVANGGLPGQTGNAKSCNYSGKEYSLGDSFASGDNCNTCTCSANGIACTEKACDVDLGTNPTPTPTGATPPANIEETLIGKLQVTDSDYFYGTTKYPAAIMNLKASDLQSITCYPAYTTTGQSAFLNTDDQPIRDNTIKSFMDSVPYQEGMYTISWCVTDSGRYVVEYGACASACGGGVATNFYFGELKNNAIIKKTLIPNQIGAYPACDTTLALSKNNELYVRCLGGEVRSTAAIYKVFLDQGNYTEIVKADY